MVRVNLFQSCYEQTMSSGFRHEKICIFEFFSDFMSTFGILQGETPEDKGYDEMRRKKRNAVYWVRLKTKT